MKLICEVYEDLQILTEVDDKGLKNFFIEGVFMQAEQKNKNGRIYPLDILSREAARYNKDFIAQNRAYGELGHPTGPTINLERVSHMIKSLKQEGNNFIGRAKILDTPYGQIVKNLMSEGCRLGVSTRGMGSLTQESNGTSKVGTDYHLATAADIVADPSAPQAFVEGIMEGREWICNNGIFKEVYIDEARSRINKSIGSRTKEKEMIKVFESFIRNL